MTKSLISEEEIIERFSNIYTGAISDILDREGYTNQVLPSEVKGITSDAKLCGTAFTVQGEATHCDDPDQIFEPILTMLGNISKNNILVSQPHDQESAHLGELVATTIQARGGNGAVIYGGIRDVDYIHKLGLPVFHVYATPADIVGRWKLKEYNTSIRIKNVTVNPGDYIVGDKDGVVVVPRDIAPEILEKVEELVTTENHVREDIQNGVHPLDSYNKHGWF